VVKVPRAAPP
jgi:hypothetical protein